MKYFINESGDKIIAYDAEGKQILGFFNPVDTYLPDNTKEEKGLDQGVPMKKKRGRQPGFSPKKKLGRPKKEIDTSPVFTGGPVIDADAKQNLKEMIQKYGRTSVHKVIDGKLKGDDMFTIADFAGLEQDEVEEIIDKCV